MADSSEFKIEKIDHDGIAQYVVQTKDPEILGVSAIPGEEADSWFVILTVAEFVRDEPLESKFRKLVDDTLNSINGVSLVEEADREVWYVEGDVSGDILVLSTVQSLNTIYNELKDYVHSY